MKQLLFTFIGFVILFSSCQNQTQKNQDKNQVEITEENLDDMDTMEYIETARLENLVDKNYFKKFDKIELAYYPHSVRSYGSMMTCSKLIKNGVFEVDSLQKKITLTKSQFQEFENLVFTPLEEADSMAMSADCFFPRHSLIFYEKEKATHIIEICFQCSNICYFPNKNTGMHLEFKFEKLETLFNKILKD